MGLNGRSAQVDRQSRKQQRKIRLSYLIDLNKHDYTGRPTLILL